MSVYYPLRIISRALAASRPQHVAFKTFDVSRKRGIRRNSIKWITKAKRLASTTKPTMEGINMEKKQTVWTTEFQRAYARGYAAAQKKARKEIVGPNGSVSSLTAQLRSKLEQIDEAMTKLGAERQELLREMASILEPTGPIEQAVKFIGNGIEQSASLQ